MTGGIGSMAVALSANVENFMSGMSRASHAIHDLKSQTKGLADLGHLLHGGARAGGFFLVGEVVKHAAHEARTLREEFDKGEIGAIGLADGIARAIPIFNIGYETGVDLKHAIFGASEAEKRVEQYAKQVNEEVREQARLFKVAEHIASSIADAHGKTRLHLAAIVGGWTEGKTAAEEMLRELRTMGAVTGYQVKQIRAVGDEMDRVAEATAQRKVSAGTGSFAMNTAQEIRAMNEGWTEGESKAQGMIYQLEQIHTLTLGQITYMKWWGREWDRVNDAVKENVEWQGYADKQTKDAIAREAAYADEAQRIADSVRTPAQRVDDQIRHAAALNEENYLSDAAFAVYEKKLNDSLTKHNWTIRGGEGLVPNADTFFSRGALNTDSSRVEAEQLQTLKRIEVNTRTGAGGAA